MSDTCAITTTKLNEKKKMKIPLFQLILITPFFILFSHYLAVFPHEFSHSFMAWMLGYKSNPLALDYGGTSLNNLLLLSNIDENVNYQSIFSSHHGYVVALISFAGPGLANGLLFIFSLILLKHPVIRNKPYLFYFIFWFNLMNLGNLYDYVPIRTFATHGDIVAITTGLNISPWWVLFIFGYLIAYLIWNFFTTTLIDVYINLKINSIDIQASIMTICVCILFGFFGGIIGIVNSGNPLGYGEITYFLSITSFLSIPGFVIAMWPTRKWVREKIKI